MTRAQISAQLRATPLFADLLGDELEELTSGTRFMNLPAGHLLYGRTARPERVFYVLEGRLTISVSGKEGADLLLSVVDKGEFLGLIGMMDEDPRGVDARTSSPARLLSIDQAVLMQILHKNAHCAIKLAGLFHELMRRGIMNVKTLGLESAEVRLWRRLMDLAQRYGRKDPAGGSLEINHGLSQQSLADSIGITRVMANRQLSDWRDRGLVETGRGRTRLPDPAALEAHVLRPRD